MLNKILVILLGSTLIFPTAVFAATAYSSIQNINLEITGGSTVSPNSLSGSSFLLISDAEGYGDSNNQRYDYFYNQPLDNPVLFSRNFDIAENMAASYLSYQPNLTDTFISSATNTRYIDGIATTSFGYRINYKAGSILTLTADAFTQVVPDSSANAVAYSEINFIGETNTFSDGLNSKSYMESITDQKHLSVSFTSDMDGTIGVFILNYAFTGQIPVQPSPVPEPSIYLMMLAGLAVISRAAKCVTRNA